MGHKELLRDIAKNNLDPKKAYIPGKNGNLILKPGKKAIIEESQDNLAVIVEDNSDGTAAATVAPDELQIADTVPVQKSKKWPPPRKKKNEIPPTDQ